MISPDRIGFRRLEKWVRIWSRKKDCEFVGILRGLPYLTSFNNIMLWFACNLFTGYKDNYAKQAGEERLKPMLSWEMVILNHYPPTLCYSTTLQVFQKNVSYRRKWSQVKAQGRKKQERIRNAKVKNQNSAHAWTFKADILHKGQKTSKWLMYKQCFGQVLSILAW